MTVWDSGTTSENGKSSTANFLSGMYKSVPPLQDMFNMAGMDLPEYLKGKDKAAAADTKTLPNKKEDNES